MAKVFRLHFNRINMQRGKPTVWTIHLSNKCIPARAVELNVPVISKFNPDGPQPRAFFWGRGTVTPLGDDCYSID